MSTFAQMDDRTRGFEEEGLALFIAEQVYARASGRDVSECVLNFPRDQFFIGNLRPTPRKSEEDISLGWVNEILDKLAPSAFGAEFRIKPESSDFAIQIRLQWSCYYRVFPTWKQQQDYRTKQSSENQTEGSSATSREEVIDVEDLRETDEGFQDDVSAEVIEVTKKRRRVRASSDDLYIRFKKVRCQTDGVIRFRFDGSDGSEWVFDAADLIDAVDKENMRAQSVALADPENLRTKGGQNDSMRVPEAVLSDQDGKSYAEFCKQLITQVVPEWKWQIKVEPPRFSEAASDALNERLVMIEFTNVTPMSEKSPNVEPFLFEVGASFKFVDCVPQPFEFDLAPRGFRYNPLIPAQGFNCNIQEVKGTEEFSLITTNMPLYIQKRYQTQSRPIANFVDLAQDPIPVLETILESMQQYLVEWDQQEVEYRTRSWWNNVYQAEYQQDRRVYQQEIERFSAGLELIRSNDDIQLAFKLTNETFRRGDPKKRSWRLFQIVFLVSQIPGIAGLANSTNVDLSERDKVDIVYFPTGGGKTEAYLSVIVFHCFFDRLRGKRAGVTAWTRFPLRLLTLQQTQRVADVIGLAELVRKEQISEPRLSGKGVAKFAVGYFVGSGATPNKLSPPFGEKIPDLEWTIASDSDARQQWKRIVRCPSCRTNTIVVDFDEKKVRLIHRCTQPNCKFEQGQLPVFVVDNEVYRYLPSVIVGTIDKLAGIGNQHKMSLILGRVEGYCKLHGYYSGKCSQDECSDQTLLVSRIPSGLSGPTLFVQDELHLLKEGLGTFDAHYETFVQRLIQEFGQDQPLKIIASSATIEAFQRQVEHLYGRDPKNARVFPGLGPTLQTSFYAETLEYPQRLYLGIIPHNKTIFNAILELIQYYHEVIQNLQRMSTSEPNPYNGLIEPGTSDWQELLDYYLTSMTYFLNTRFLYSVKTDLEDTNTNLERGGYRPLTTAELTGSVSTKEIATTLECLERQLAPSSEIIDVILATNMVSHGVDIDRLNSIIFYGMPAQVAEYIQSSSRVGRTHVGLVFMCLHPVHERDQSHYTYFAKFHEFLGQLIEPVAINRWSRFSIQRTLPGLFMAVLLQLIGNQSGDKSPGRYTRLDFVKKQIRDGKIKIGDFIPFLEQAYQVVDLDTPGARAFRQEIQLRVGQFFDQILGAGPPTEWVSDALIPAPMTSLRDVDEQLVVELDDVGSRWASFK